MNFQEWYKFGTPEEQNCFMGDAEKGWEACKSEVLRILENNPRCDYYYFDLKDEIEKL